MMALASTGAPAAPASSFGRCAAFVVGYLALAGVAVWAGLAEFGTRPGLGAALVCAAPAVAGLALACSPGGERRRSVVRLALAGLLLPLLLLAAVGLLGPEAPQPASVGVFVAVFALVHLMASVTGVVLLAAAATRVAAVAGVMPVGAGRLGRRLASLADAGLALSVHEAAAGWQVEIDSEAGRSRRLHLQVDELTSQVIVHERLGAAAPAAQPGTTVIWSHEWQATPIGGAPLDATVLAFDGDRSLPPRAARGFDGDALVRLLCALVTRSGYDWQPVLLGWPKRRRALR